MGIQSFTGLLSALCLTEADFDRFFPELGYVKHAKTILRQIYAGNMWHTEKTAPLIETIYFK